MSLVCEYRVVTYMQELVSCIVAHTCVLWTHERLTQAHCVGLLLCPLFVEGFSRKARFLKQFILKNIKDL